MSDTATLQPNKTVLILVAAIVLLLAVIIGIVVAGNGSDVPDPVATTSTDAGNTGMPTGVAPAATDFDPTTATQVPADTTPEEFVAAYYEAVLAGDWETAYYGQPAHKQGGDVQAFADQLLGYGIAGYQVYDGTEAGTGVYTVVADQETAQFGTFVNEWVFLDYNGTWVVQDKAVAGMK